MELPGPERYVCFRLAKVMRKVQRYYEGPLASYGITPGQFYVLSALTARNGLKFKELARIVAIDGSTLTGILDRMERGGFIARRDDPEDRRSLLVFLTDRGREVGPELISLAEKLDREIREQFSPGEWEIFLRVLDGLAGPGYII